MKLTVSISPELRQKLADYAVFYETSYGRAEPVMKLAPAILAAFIDADRASSSTASDAKV